MKGSIMKLLVFIACLILINCDVVCAKKSSTTKRLKNSITNGFGNSLGRDIEKKTIKLIKVDTDKKTTSGKPIKEIRIVPNDTTNKVKQNGKKTF